MVVEPESLCGMTGRMVEARDGLTWAEEFARFPALEAVVRDDGTGLRVCERTGLFAPTCGETFPS